MSDLEYWKELARLRGEMLAALLSGNSPKYAALSIAATKLEATGPRDVSDEKRKAVLAAFERCEQEVVKILA